MLLGLLALGKFALSFRKKRKGKRALGSSPDVHVAKMKTEVSRSLDLSERAVEHAAKGRCDVALKLYGGAEAALGAARQESENFSASNREALSKLREEADRAERAVRSCYISRR